MIISNNNSNNIPKEVVLQKIFPYFDVKTVLTLPRISRSYRESFDNLMKELRLRLVNRDRFPFTSIEKECNPAINFLSFVARFDHLNRLKASIRKSDEGAREGKIEGSILSWKQIPGLTCSEYERKSEDFDQAITGEVREASIKANWTKSLGMPVLTEIPNFSIGMAMGNLCTALIVTWSTISDSASSFNLLLINFVLPCFLEIRRFFALSALIKYSSDLSRQLNVENIKMRAGEEASNGIVIGTLVAVAVRSIFSRDKEIPNDLCTLLLAGISNFVGGVLWGPQEMNMGQKIKSGIMAIKMALKIILKKVWECRTAILSLAVLSTFCYYNTTADAIVAPFYRPVLDMLADLGDKAHVGSILEALGLEGVEKNLFFIGMCSYVVSYISKPFLPFLVNFGKKMVTLIKILSAIPYRMTRIGLNMIRMGLNITREILRYKNEILALLILGMVCYYNPTANALVAPYYWAMMDLLAGLRNQVNHHSFAILDSILARVEGTIPGSANNIVEMHAYLIDLIERVSERGKEYFGDEMQVLKVLLENMVSSITDLGRAS